MTDRFTVSGSPAHQSAPLRHKAGGGGACSMCSRSSRSVAAPPAQGRRRHSRIDGPSSRISRKPRLTCDACSERPWFRGPLSLESRGQRTMCRHCSLAAVLRGEGKGEGRIVQDIPPIPLPRGGRAALEPFGRNGLDSPSCVREGRPRSGRGGSSEPAVNSTSSGELALSGPSARLSQRESEAKVTTVQPLLNRTTSERERG
jgi:hypothetical protein